MDINVWFNAMQGHVNKLTKMDVSKNVTKTVVTVDTNVSRFVILVSNVKSFHVKLKY